MDTLIHADIFFFVTTILVVVLALLALILVFYVIKIGRTIFSITETIKKESENVVEDISMFRQKMRDDSDKMKGFGGIVRKLFMGGAFIRNAAKRTSKKRESK